MCNRYTVKNFHQQPWTTKNIFTHNIFAQGPCARSITLNTHILVLFANKRDESQADVLGKQLYPGAVNVFREAYADATAIIQDI